jgi:hypothetical protein
MRWKIFVCLLCGASLGGCVYATSSPGLKPVAENGWQKIPDGPNSDPGSVRYSQGRASIMIAPPVWHQSSYAGLGLPLVPVSSVDKPARFYVAVNNGDGNGTLELRDAELHCTKQGSNAESVVGFDVTVVQRNIAYLLPRGDLASLASCRLQLSEAVKAGLGKVPDLQLVAGTIRTFGGVE